MGRPKKVIPKIYRCLRCDASYESSRNFFINKNSELYQANDGCVCICKKCVDAIYDSKLKKYNSVRRATIIVCAMLDIPFIRELFESVRNSAPVFEMGFYIRRLNNRQYSRKTFEYSISEGELDKTVEQVNEKIEERWDKDELKVKNEIIELVGYDPFDSYPPNDRKILFAELAKFIGEDDDPWKTKQFIKAVVLDFQISRYDKILARLDPINNANEYASISILKKDAVASLDKIAKENEISIKSRSNKEAGRSTLTYLMRDLREKNFEDAEEDYYNQLRSAGTQWAADMSAKAIMTNASFDENDRLDIQNKRNDLIKKLYQEVDDLKEKNRVLMNKIRECGGDVSAIE